jgi:hypothetical protein
MIDSPREVTGAVLKHLGSSYNTTDMDAEVSGGKEAVLKSFTQLQKQVCTDKSAIFLWHVTTQRFWSVVRFVWFILVLSGRFNYLTAWIIWSHFLLEMYGLLLVGAVMSSLLQSECLMLQWLFPSQAVAYGLIYGYVVDWCIIMHFRFPELCGLGSLSCELIGVL